MDNNPPPNRNHAPVAVPVHDGLTLYTKFDPVKQIHLITCDLCGQVITLTSGGHAEYFKRHHDSKVCRKNVRKQQRELSRSQMAALRATIGVTSAQSNAGGSSELGSSSSFTSTPFRNYHEMSMTSATSTPRSTPFVAAPSSSQAPHSICALPRLHRTSPIPV